MSVIGLFAKNTFLSLIEQSYLMAYFQLFTGLKMLYFGEVEMAYMKALSTVLHLVGVWCILSADNIHRAFQCSLGSWGVFSCAIVTVKT